MTKTREKYSKLDVKKTDDKIKKCQASGEREYTQEDIIRWLKDLSRRLSIIEDTVEDIIEELGCTDDLTEEEDIDSEDYLRAH